MRVDVGDVVLIDYKEFDGTESTGIYLVIYHESYDIRNSNLFCACKVSTNPSGFQVYLPQTQETYLNHDSYANCTTIHRFSEYQVKGVLGTMTKKSLGLVLNQINKFTKSMGVQLVSKVGRNNLI